MMGFTPQEVDAMSLYQFNAALAGFAHFHGGETPPEAPSDDDIDRMTAAIERL
jgi:hypothetical protein